MSAPVARTRYSVIAHNLRRLMAREGLTYEDVVEATGLDARTLRGIVRAVKRPHSKTLQRLAEGLGVEVDELFLADEAAALAEFDAATNPEIEQAVEKSPDLFEGWTPSDFGELASRVGVGGALTATGVIQAARRMNQNRATLDRARLILESHEADALRSVIDALYERAIVRE